MLAIGASDVADEPSSIGKSSFLEADGSGVENPDVVTLGDDSSEAEPSVEASEIAVDDDEGSPGGVRLLGTGGWAAIDEDEGSVGVVKVDVFCSAEFDTGAAGLARGLVDDLMHSGGIAMNEMQS